MSISESLHQEIEHLQSAVRELTILNEIAMAASSSMSVDQILEIIIKQSIKSVGAEQCAIMMVSKNSTLPMQTLIRKQQFSGSMPSYKLGGHITGWVLKNSIPLIIDNLEIDERFKVSKDEIVNIKTVLAIPIYAQGTIIGVLTMTNKKNDQRFSKDDLRLMSIIVAQAGQLIRNRQLQQIENEKMRLEHELDLARSVQQNLLPKYFPNIPNLDVATHFRPAQAVGGDYYDFFNYSENKFAIVIADVSGHGPSSAMIMSMIKGILHSISESEAPPDKALFLLNRIVGKILPPDIFITMMYLLIDVDEKYIFIANAGHCPLLIYNANSALVTPLEHFDFALNLSRDAKYTIETKKLHDGDLLLLYTDGIIEATNSVSEMFGINRLVSMLGEMNRDSADKIVASIMDRVDAFCGISNVADDMILMAIRVK